MPHLFIIPRHMVQYLVLCVKNLFNWVGHPQIKDKDIIIESGDILMDSGRWKRNSFTNLAIYG